MKKIGGQKSRATIPLKHVFCFHRNRRLRKLQAKHVRKVGDTVRFTFPSLKNDQMHQGQVTLVTADNSELCPVQITELYFQWFGYGWGQEGGDP
jgi:hypothetical protein